MVARIRRHPRSLILFACLCLLVGATVLVYSGEIVFPWSCEIDGDSGTVDLTGIYEEAGETEDVRLLIYPEDGKIILKADVDIVVSLPDGTVAPSKLQGVRLRGVADVGGMVVSGASAKLDIPLASELGGEATYLLSDVEIVISTGVVAAFMEPILLRSKSVKVDCSAEVYAPSVKIPGSFDASCRVDEANIVLEIDPEMEDLYWGVTAYPIRPHVMQGDFGDVKVTVWGPPWEFYTIVLSSPWLPEPITEGLSGDSSVNLNIGPGAAGDIMTYDVVATDEWGNEVKTGGSIKVLSWSLEVWADKYTLNVGETTTAYARFQIDREESVDVDLSAFPGGHIDSSWGVGSADASGQLGPYAAPGSVTIQATTYAPYPIDAFRYATRRVAIVGATSQPPLAKITGPDFAFIGTEVTLDGSTSEDQDETGDPPAIRKYRWKLATDPDWGAWQDASTYKVTPTEIGPIEVKLQVKDNDDEVSEETYKIITAGQLTIEGPDKVQLDNNVVSRGALREDEPDQREDDIHTAEAYVEIGDDQRKEMTEAEASVNTKLALLGSELSEDKKTFTVSFMGIELSSAAADAIITVSANVDNGYESVEATGKHKATVVDTTLVDLDEDQTKIKKVKLYNPSPLVVIDDDGVQLSQPEDGKLTLTVTGRAESWTSGSLGIYIGGDAAGDDPDRDDQPLAPDKPEQLINYFRGEVELDVSFELGEALMKDVGDPAEPWDIFTIPANMLVRNLGYLEREVEMVVHTTNVLANVGKDSVILRTVLTDESRDEIMGLHGRAQSAKKRAEVFRGRADDFRQKASAAKNSRQRQVFEAKAQEFDEKADEAEELAEQAVADIEDALKKTETIVKEEKPSVPAKLLHIENYQFKVRVRDVAESGSVQVAYFDDQSKQAKTAVEVDGQEGTFLTQKLATVPKLVGPAVHLLTGHLGRRQLSVYPEKAGEFSAADFAYLEGMLIIYGNEPIDNFADVLEEHYWNYPTDNRYVDDRKYTIYMGRDGSDGAVGAGVLVSQDAYGVQLDRLIDSLAPVVQDVGYKRQSKNSTEAKYNLFISAPPPYDLEAVSIVGITYPYPLGDHVPPERLDHHDLNEQHVQAGGYVRTFFTHGSNLEAVGPSVDIDVERLESSPVPGVPDHIEATEGTITKIVVPGLDPNPNAWRLNISELGVRPSYMANLFTYRFEVIGPSASKGKIKLLRNGAVFMTDAETGKAVTPGEFAGSWQIEATETGVVDLAFSAYSGDALISRDKVRVNCLAIEPKPGRIIHVNSADEFDVAEEGYEARDTVWFALLKAASNDNVVIGKGTYIESRLSVPQDVLVVGLGGSFDAAPPHGFQHVGLPVINGSMRQIFHVSPGGQEATEIACLEITLGRAPEAPAIRAEGGKVGIYFNNIHNNWAAPSPAYGAGIYVANASEVTVFGNRIQNNTCMPNMSDENCGGGGGYFVDCENVLIEKNLISGNRARYGAGIAVRGTGAQGTGHVEILDNRIDFNNTFGFGFGGGIAIVGEYDDRGALAVDGVLGFVRGDNGGVPECIISRNEIILNDATGDVEGRGGGIYATAGYTVVTLQENLIELNGSEGDGAGITIFMEATANATDNTIVHNGPSGDDGGGISHGTWSAGVWTGNTVSHNMSQVNGGGMHVSVKGDITIDGNFFNDNRAIVDGGGIYVRDSRLTSTGDNEINRNKARNGAGVFLQVISESCPNYLASSSGFLTLARGDVVSGNIASRHGGGLFAGDMSLSDNLSMHVSLSDVIVSDNAAGAGLEGFSTSGIYLYQSTEGVAVSSLISNSIITRHAGAGLTVLGGAKVEGNMFGHNRVGINIVPKLHPLMGTDVEGNYFFDNSTCHVNVVNSMYTNIVGNYFLRLSMCDFGVRVDRSDYSSGELSIRKNSFVGHNLAAKSYAVYVVSPSIGFPGGYSFIKAENNWWNSAGGPHDPPSTGLDGDYNTNPAGDRVWDAVDYRPWAKGAF